ncbi:MAG: MFS transporter [Pseudomonadota bacterium]
MDRPDAPQTGPEQPLERSVEQDTDLWSVVTVTVGITVFSVAQGLTYPLIALILAQRGVSDAMIGLNAAAYVAGIGLSVFLMPALSRHLRASQVIVAGLLGTALVVCALAVTESLAAWFALRFLMGGCVNAIYVFGEAWLNAATADRIRGRVSGIYSAGMSTGFVAGPLAIPLFGTANGLGFAACALLLAAVAFVLSLVARRARIEPEKPVLSDVPAFLRAAPALAALVLLFGFTDLIALAMSPVHMINGGATEAAAAALVAVLCAGMVLAQPLLGVLLDRVNRWTVARGCLWTSAAVFAVLTLVPVSSMLIWPLAALGGGAISGLYTCALAILGRACKGRMLVAGASVFSLAYAGGGLMGPVISGGLSSVAPGLLFLPIVGVGIVGALLLARQR